MFILTVRNDRLGDLILAVPTLAALRERYPDARLGIVTAPHLCELFRLYPDPIDVWPDGKESRSRMRSERPDVILFLYPDWAWVRAAFRARVPRRIGTTHRLQAVLFNERVDVRRRQRGVHEAQCNLRTASPLTGECGLPAVRFVVPPDVRRATDHLLSGLGLHSDQRFIAVHPGSRGSAWHWPERRFTELVERMGRQGVRIVVTGGPGEEALCRRVAGTHAVSLAGVTDLPMLGGVLSRAEALVAGSTGPMHLAAVLDTPVAALFSPLPSHAASRWGPLGSQHTVLTPTMPAGPIPPAEGTEEDIMASISPAQVEEAVLARYRSVGGAP